MEIIEHVENVDLFLEKAISLLKPGGMFFLSTISKSYLAYLVNILAAEKILKMIPEGTHQYEKFLNAEDLTEFFKKKDFELLDQKFFIYDPFKK